MQPYLHSPKGVVLNTLGRHLTYYRFFSTKIAISSIPLACITLFIPKNSTAYIDCTVQEGAQPDLTAA
jgi:hypothetical protein